MKKLQITTAIAVATLATALCSAQISYDTLGSIYTETFSNGTDGWSTTNGYAASNWADNSTVPGWYASYWNITTSTATPPTSYAISAGAQYTSTSLYVFRDVANPTDGSLGSFPVNAHTNTANGGGVYIGVQIQNNTGTTITSFDLGYTMEFWRLSNGAIANSFTVSYQVGATSLTSGTWIDVPALTATSPAGPVSGSAAQSGNASGNYTVIDPVSVSGVSIAPGETIWIRWFDINDTNTDNGISIDNVTFSASAVPEPSAFAALAGLGVLGMAILRRRR